MVFDINTGFCPSGGGALWQTQSCLVTLMSAAKYTGMGERIAGVVILVLLFMLSFVSSDPTVL